MPSITNSEMERVDLNYKNLSEKFADHPSDYNRQYCSIYTARLKEMDPLLRNRIKHKWGDQYPVIKLHKLSEEDVETCIVIGTLFKDQKLKPSILREISEANQLVSEANPILNNFTDDSDKLFIEDEAQRYEIEGNISLKQVVTGITIALLGSDAGKGKFVACEYLFVGYPEQIERPLFNDDTFAVFVSGLDFVHYEKHIVNLQLLMYWLTGMCENVQKVARVIIAGNSLKIEATKRKPTISLISRVPESAESIESIKLFDGFLSQLSSIVEVDVMPGEHDPSNQILPQRPMHPCMFPRSASYKSLNLVSNPYSCSLDGFRVCGTSGSPVQNIMWYSDNKTPLGALRKCLEWGHLAPTAPDTLGCYPYYDRDPFVMQDCPHAFFAGNQSEFDTEIVTGERGQTVRLISVPKFCTTHEVVLLNLKTLDCAKMAFEEI
ncbi:unnamed protein product [Phyllotreta striolata]|uniref:DNA polymerase delta small subunit n=1 Tax=Phyllotreta striolata TaxID=444603 RepID=A0A9N9TWX7_PHYSR|nr:unnamed protein product [Phyllotreta striolata]